MPRVNPFCLIYLCGLNAYDEFMFSLFTRWAIKRKLYVGVVADLVSLANFFRLHFIDVRALSHSKPLYVRGLSLPKCSLFSHASHVSAAMPRNVCKKLEDDQQQFKFNTFCVSFIKIHKYFWPYWRYVRVCRRWILVLWSVCTTLNGSTCRVRRRGAGRGRGCGRGSSAPLPQIGNERC